MITIGINYFFFIPYLKTQVTSETPLNILEGEEACHYNNENDYHLSSFIFPFDSPWITFFFHCLFFRSERLDFKIPRPHLTFRMAYVVVQFIRIVPKSY